MIRLKYFFVSVAILLIAISCKHDPRSSKSIYSSKDTSMVVSNKETPKTIDRINFYFENSGSMNGYLSGKNFKQTMHEIITDDDPRLTPYFVNTKEYLTSNLLSKIDAKNIGTAGTSSSDHQFIFTNAIKNTIGNNLSIVVTDGIYSTPSGDVDIVEVDIKKAFEKALNENAIETVVLKLSSHYKGIYYTESDCKNVSIDQERPYYILLFGNKETIDNALKDIVTIEELPGFKEQARFFLTNNMKVDYTILTQGEEKKGSFRRVVKGGNGLVTEIEDAERFNRGNEKYLQFAIAIDYSKLSIPDSYLLFKDNYEIDGGTGYKIEDIKTVESLSNSTTYSTIEKINEKENISLSHLIVLKAEFNYTGELEIELENNLPSWIKTTGLENDCDIKDNKSKTFAFDNLMIGISNAYNKVSDNKEYLELKLKIKH